MQIADADSSMVVVLLVIRGWREAARPGAASEVVTKCSFLAPACKMLRGWRGHTEHAREGGGADGVTPGKASSCADKYLRAVRGVK